MSLQKNHVWDAGEFYDRWLLVIGAESVGTTVTLKLDNSSTSPRQGCIKLLGSARQSRRPQLYWRRLLSHLDFGVRALFCGGRDTIEMENGNIDRPTNQDWGICSHSILAPIMTSAPIPSWVQHSRQSATGQMRCLRPLSE